MAEYIQEISQQAISNILGAIRQFRKGEFKDDRNLPKAIAAILETAIKDKDMQEFAIENYSQIVGILMVTQPKHLAIKKNIEGKLFFQVDDDSVDAY